MEAKKLGFVIDKNHFKHTSLNFRKLTRKLICNKKDEYLNLKNFIFYLENNIIIWNFIETHQQYSFDIAKEVDNKKLYELTLNNSDKNFEISFIYHLIKFCLEKQENYFLIRNYYNSVINENIDFFNSRLVNLLAGYIDLYLIEMGLEIWGKNKYFKTSHNYVRNPNFQRMLKDFLNL